MGRTKAEIRAEIKKVQDEIIRLDNKYHFSADDVEVDKRTLERISKKIDHLQMLQDLIKEY